KAPRIPAGAALSPGVRRPAPALPAAVRPRVLLWCAASAAACGGGSGAVTRVPASGQRREGGEGFPLREVSVRTGPGICGTVGMSTGQGSGLSASGGTPTSQAGGTTAQVEGGPPLAQAGDPLARSPMAKPQPGRPHIADRGAAEGGRDDVTAVTRAVLTAS